MSFSYALLCFLLASTASAAGPGDGANNQPHPPPYAHWPPYVPYPPPPIGHYPPPPIGHYPPHMLPYVNPGADYQRPGHNSYRPPDGNPGTNYQHPGHNLGTNYHRPGRNPGTNNECKNRRPDRKQAQASAERFANPGPDSGPLDNLVAHGDGSYWPTVDDCALEEAHVYRVRRSAVVSHDLIRGNSRNLTVLLQGLRFNPTDKVTVVYIGPVPRFRMIAYVLVLETVTEYRPKEYKEVKLATLFGEGQNVPGEIFFYLPQREKEKN
jgi:hypothetical protein